MKNCWTGDRVKLRPFEKADAERWSDPSAFIDTVTNRLCDRIYLPQNREVSLAGNEEQFSKPMEEESYRFMIDDAQTGENVGTINVHGADPLTGCFSYGLAIWPQARRKGYAYEAVKLVLRFYFLERRYEKCNLQVYAFNEASLGFHDRFGFVREGCLRQNEYFFGKRWDVICFGMTKEEFIQKHMDSMEY